MAVAQEVWTGKRPLDHRRSPVYPLIGFFRHYGMTVWVLLVFLESMVFIPVPWVVGLLVIGLTAALERWCVRHARDLTLTDEALLTMIRRRGDYDNRDIRMPGWRTILLFFGGVVGLVVLAGGVLPMLWPGRDDMLVASYVLCNAAFTLSTAAMSRYWGDVFLRRGGGFSRYPPHDGVMRSSGFARKERVVHEVLKALFVPLAIRYRIIAIVAQFGVLVAGVMSIFFAAQGMIGLREEGVVFYVVSLFLSVVFVNLFSLSMTIENLWSLRLQSLVAQVVWDEAHDPKGPGRPKPYWFDRP